ncbi:MAG: acyltransferase [Tildeniella nuda ZEHNDER 1965/U140]|jgi:peptidoglycan/LPS O-acetylase OafA/YrhL|nr:acyltransferase [Tildeniella nuda ZEHNDER 1965/U140]
MTLTSIFPAIGLSILFFGAAKLVVSRSVFYQSAIQTANKAQFKALDGLRGFLALGVFFHHAVVSYQYFQLGIWQSAPSNVYAFLGQGAVVFFFMITGFLFWSKIIVEPKFNIKRFYIRRALRVLPAYWFSLAIMILIVLIMSNFSLRVSLPRFLLQVGSWLICGIYGFSDADKVLFPDINYGSVGLINASVQWTLRYELQFYLLLPLLAWFVKPLRFIGLFVALLACILLTRYFPLLTLMNFMFGMAAAYLVKRFESKKWFLDRRVSLGIIFLLAAIPLLIPQPYISNQWAIVLIFCAFVFIASGNDLFGLLTAPASKYLGTISYSVYLLHGIVLFCVLRLVNLVYPIKGMHPLYFWVLAGVCGLLVIGLSGITYRFIEHPFLQLKPSSSAVKKPDIIQTNFYSAKK